MRRLILILALLLWLAFPGVAETYQITALNTPTITIGSKKLKVGDRFSDPKDIKWSDNSQLMEVKALSTGALYVFSRKVFETKGAVSIADYFLKTNKGSSRGKNTTPLFSVSPAKNNYPEKRIALVIGNSNYENLSFLRNAQKDATDLAETLKQLGFDVMEIYESDYSGMKTALNNFASKAKNYDVALFYYAGHGIQDKGQNYLVPIERELELPSEVNQCLNCDDVMQLMEDARVPAKLMFIDACRNTQKSWTRAADKGLARMEGPVGSVILFSTQSGNVALDGTGDNSPFAQSLIKNIRIPDISFNDAIDGVVRDTYSLTNAEQCPLKIGTLLTPFSFNSVIRRPEASQVKTAVSTDGNIDTKLIKAKDYYSKKDYAQAYKLFMELAGQGNNEAQNYLGDMYYEGYGVEKNYTEAVKWYRKAAEQGDSSAQHSLGYMYDEGYGVEKNYTEAAKWYRMAAEQGYSKAQNNLGGMYWYGDGVEQSLAEAVKWYRMAAEQGYSKAQYNLGHMYWNGDGVEQNYAEAVKWYRKAAEQGYSDAQNNLGVTYYFGLGSEQNYAEAAKWYRMAAEQGNSTAQKNLGAMYQNGYGVDENYEEAAKWYRMAAEQGDSVSQKNLGDMYRYGNGVEKNYAEAVKWYRKVADRGDSEAQNNLGEMYWHGYGIEKSFAEAAKWYRKAAEQGHSKAQNYLGVMYHEGLGVEKNYAEAVKWYRMAAVRGNFAAQYNLGQMYEDGLGVSKDEAYEWYKKTADNGYKFAKEWIAEHPVGTSNAITVTGTIIDDSGEPLIGASVIVEEMKTGTSTDIDGNFTLKNIPDGSILKVSYIGYKSQTVKVTSKNAAALTIKLKKK